MDANTSAPAQPLEFSSTDRSDWYAKGMPEDHPYAAWLRQPLPETSTEGLVTFADGSRYAGRQA